jgi:glycosyltransferase involved in cell wall biosynthesis
MSGSGFDSVICFGGEDWWYHNRGHIDMQLMRRFVRLGGALYVNSIVMQKPNLAQGRKLIQKLKRKVKSILKGLQKSDAGFWVYSPFSLPVHHIGWLKAVNTLILRLQLWVVAHKLGLRNPIIWVACPAACEAAIRMRRAKLVYQRTDRFEEFPGVDPDTIKNFDRKLKLQADLTVFVNNTLFGEEAGQCKKAIFLDHGVDYDMFASAEQDANIPADIADIPKPIIGFYGGFAEHTTDVALLKKIVDLLPQRSFVFVGRSSQECNALKSKKNVWMLGQKPYEQIPRYGKCFDVAIMPWRQNRWIQACNPIKLKEYLALGKPIVSTPFNELNKYLDVVYQAETADGFARAIEKALAEDNLQRVSARRSKVMNASWDSKAKKVIEELYPHKGGSR